LGTGETGSTILAVGCRVLRDEGYPRKGDAIIPTDLSVGQVNHRRTSVEPINWFPENMRRTVGSPRPFRARATHGYGGQTATRFPYRPFSNILPLHNKIVMYEINKRINMANIPVSWCVSQKRLPIEKGQRPGFIPAQPIGLGEWAQWIRGLKARPMIGYSLDRSGFQPFFLGDARSLGLRPRLG
jgi:hypothetical protein